jgi:hypothetical protein
MTTDHLVYRGVPYGSHQHQPLASVEAVEHVYRGVHYSEPLQHQPHLVDESLELHYRGHVYHHRQQQAQRDLQAG